MTQHLEKLMEDIDLYGWERVRAYNGLWLIQLEVSQSGESLQCISQVVKAYLARTKVH